MKHIVFILFYLITACATIIPPEAADVEEIKNHQVSFAEKSQGLYTLEEVQAIPIYIKPYYRLNIKNQKWEKQYTNTVGICYPLGPLTFITISEGWWNKNTDEKEREQLIFHELGHCLLLEAHSAPAEGKGAGDRAERFLFNIGVFEERKRLLKDYCPSSYMHPYTLEKHCISAHYEYYIEELFRRTTREIYENEL